MSILPVFDECLNRRPTITFAARLKRRTVWLKALGCVGHFVQPRISTPEGLFFWRMACREIWGFDYDCTHLNILADMASANTPPLSQRVFTLDGLIAIGLFSE